MNPLLFLTLAVFLSTSLMANTTDEINLNIRQLEGVINDHSRRIDQKQKLAQDLNSIILDAISKVQARLNQMPPGQGGGRGHGGGRGRGGGRGHGGGRGNGGGRGHGGGRGNNVNMTLVQISLKRCSDLYYSTDKTSCFASYLKDTVGLLGLIGTTCSEKFGHSPDSASCFINGLKSINQDSTLESVALSSRQKLYYSTSRVICYNSMLSSKPSAPLQNILYNACKNTGHVPDSSDCYTKGLKSNSDNAESLLLNACSSLYYSVTRSNCYKSGIKSSDEHGFNLSLYARGCMKLDPVSASDCFTKVFKNLLQ